MNILLEPAQRNAIQSYSDLEITLNQITYQNSLIITRDHLITDWPIQNIQELNEENLAPILTVKPKIIIIGHRCLGKYPPMATLEYLSKLRIGLECMTVGSASRTFNILLGEHREVVLGIIQSSSP